MDNVIYIDEWQKQKFQRLADMLFDGMTQAQIDRAIGDYNDRHLGYSPPRNMQGEHLCISTPSVRDQSHAGIAGTENAR